MEHSLKKVPALIKRLNKLGFYTLWQVQLRNTICIFTKLG